LNCLRIVSGAAKNAKGGKGTHSDAGLDEMFSVLKRQQRLLFLSKGSKPECEPGLKAEELAATAMSRVDGARAKSKTRSLCEGERVWQSGR
jgi:hypothetical protein